MTCQSMAILGNPQPTTSFLQEMATFIHFALTWNTFYELPPKLWNFWTVTQAGSAWCRSDWIWKMVLLRAYGCIEWYKVLSFNMPFPEKNLDLTWNGWGHYIHQQCRIIQKCKLRWLEGKCAVSQIDWPLIIHIFWLLN